jgi:Aminoglycoside-2''-adenylyltransferase
VVEPGNARQLRSIEEFAAAAAGCGAPFWLRGGWAMDFFLGRITREHEDVDLFIWARDADRVVAELVRREFEEVGGPPPQRQRNLRRDGVEIHVTLLEPSPGGVRTAAAPREWPDWPTGMLDAPPGRLGDLVCPIVSAESQIEVKRRFQLVQPDRPGRAKDQEDIALLEEALAVTPPRRRRGGSAGR